MIEVRDLTLTYASGRGIFDVDFTVKEGELLGYLGPNGAGKTTTIRALMGFMRPQKGSCRIQSQDCWEQACQLQNLVGYIPGEIAFPDSMDGDEFLRFMQAMRRSKNNVLQKSLLDRFELDPKGKIRRFSKGMKQKLGIVTAFMHDPLILILDEPTSGLDPLMQNRFIEMILAEKQRGKTVLLSSHMFEEVERTCDTVVIIKDGSIVSQSDVKTLKASQRQCFTVAAADMQALQAGLKAHGFGIGAAVGDAVDVYAAGSDLDRFVKVLAGHTITSFTSREQSLEDIFLQFYSGEVE